MRFAAMGALLALAGSKGSSRVRNDAARIAPKPWRDAPVELNRAALGDRGWRSPRLASRAESPSSRLEAGRPEAGALSSRLAGGRVDAAGTRGGAVSKRVDAAGRSGVYMGPDPFAARALYARERSLLASSSASEGGGASVESELLPPELLGSPEKSVLGVVVEFEPPGDSETFSRIYPLDVADPSLGCTTIDQTFPALRLGDDPAPGPYDNFIFFKPDIGVDDYRSAYFGVGPNAGYGVVRPDLGGIDLSGYSLNNYLLEMSRGTYTTSGDILDAPVSVPHSHEYYGYVVYAEDEEGGCVATADDDAGYFELIEDVLDEVSSTYDGVVDFSQFDADGDHIVDLLVVIHAGYARQGGGNEDRLSTSSSGFFEPVQVSGLLTPEDDSDDYFISGFNVDPEQLDIGAIQEEFEHQFGLPDLYTTDLENSNAWWGAHSAGVWGGPLGGARPVGHNLWQDWVLGWRHPLVIDYDDPRLLSGRLSLDIGRARDTPEGVADGVIVRLPDSEQPVPNLAGGGTGWYSNSDDLLDNRVSRSFDLSAASAPITFSFASAWDIEADWDYGLIELSTDGGVTWFTRADVDGILTDADPNELGVVAAGQAWGLTGEGAGRLSFDLSEYAGTTLDVRLRYLTDAAVANPGWHVDDLSLSDATGSLYANDLETDFSDWTNAGWLATPLTRTFPRYYLFEWRDDNGYDASLDTAYQFAYVSPVEPPPARVADRFPYTTPGLIVALRDTRQGFDYTLDDVTVSGESIGPKFAHLVVESHPDPLRFDTPDEELGGWVGIDQAGRVQPGDAAFGVTPTVPWTARLDLDPASGTTLETKTFPSRPPVREFHDSYGYYPGLFAAPDGALYFNDIEASAVLPSKGPYSTRITDVDGNPATALYGSEVAGFTLGSGNPGDDLVQFGLHVSVVSSSESRARIQIWNSPFEVRVQSSNTSVTADSGAVSLTLLENIGGKLVQPAVVLELPSGFEYVPGSAMGGLEPVDPELASSQAVANSLRGGVNTKHEGSNVRYLVWRGDTIPTAGSVPPFGFRYRARPGTTGSIEATFFKNANERFQTERVSLGQLN